MIRQLFRFAILAGLTVQTPQDPFPQSLTAAPIGPIAVELSCAPSYMPCESSKWVPVRLMWRAEPGATSYIVEHNWGAASQCNVTSQQSLPSDTTAVISARVGWLAPNTTLSCPIRVRAYRNGRATAATQWIDIPFQRIYK